MTAGLIFAVFGALAPAQRVDRLAAGIQNHDKTRLRGTRNALVEQLPSEGPLDDAERVGGISLRFRPTAQQQEELDQLLADQQNPWSAHYHEWLTPEDFGDRFGLSNGDYGRVREWIEGQGFRVENAARSRTHITFSGTAAQVRAAFLTDMHRFRVGGKLRYANVDEVALPKDLEALVYDVRGLDRLRAAASAKPEANRDNGAHGLVPGDLAKIYNLAPIHEKGFDGGGQKIAIVGQSKFDMADVRTFRNTFGLPENDPQVMLLPGEDDPGESDTDEAEAVMDVEYASAAAPKASIVYIYAYDSNDAAEYVIDRNLAPVLSNGNIYCETFTSKRWAERFRNVAQQANAQGITYIAGSGASGPAACEEQAVDKAGRRMAVSIPASAPEVTAVGATQFDEKPGAEYWDPKAAPNRPSALGYIPEAALNETERAGALMASGGGASIHFRKPEWQTGAGVPEADARHVPDLAFAGSFHQTPYAVFWRGEMRRAGGTSPGTSFFAGVVSALNQYVVRSGAQGKPGLGNINPRLYALAQAAPSVFHDITSGDNIVPCAKNAAGCPDGKFGYKAGPGYDMATGLGSVDIKNLFDNWVDPKKAAAVETSLTLTASPVSLLSDGSSKLTATVKAATGKESPTGAVSFRTNDAVLGTAALSGSGGTAAATYTVTAKELKPGLNPIVAVYVGDGGFKGSTGRVQIGLIPQTGPSVVVATVNPNPVYREEPDEDGYEWSYTVELKETGGVFTHFTSFSIDGHDFSKDIEDWFGSTLLRANSTLRAQLRGGDLEVPMDVVFAFGGQDPEGQKWTKQVTVAFRGKKDAGSGATTAAISLKSVPAVVVKVGNGDPNCSPDRPYYQKLVVTETNGVDVNLTKFVAGGGDYSSSIAKFFGSSTLPGNGSLTAGLCWQLSTVPTTIQYEMGGVDKGGTAVKATLAVEFKSLDQKSGDEPQGLVGLKALAWPAAVMAPGERFRMQGRITIGKRP